MLAYFLSQLKKKKKKEEGTMSSRSDQIICCLSLPAGKSGVLIVHIDEENL